MKIRPVIFPMPFMKDWNRKGTRKKGVQHNNNNGNLFSSSYRLVSAPSLVKESSVVTQPKAAVQWTACPATQSINTTKVRLKKQMSGNCLCLLG